MIAGPFIVTIPAGATEAEVDTGVIIGFILEVGIEITLDNGSSLDIAIATKGTTALTKPILTLANATADAWYSPRTAQHAVADGSAISNMYTAGIAVQDAINIAVTGAGAGDELKVWFLVLE